MTRRGWTLFVVLGVVWGVPYLLIRVAVDDLDPAVVAFGRCLIGALLLLPLAVRRGAIRPVLALWKPLLLFSAIEIVVPWLLLGHAETRLNSSTAGLLVAVTPMLAAVFLTILGDDRLDPRRLAGLAVGIGGVGALVGIDVDVHDLPAVAAVGVVALGYAAGPIVITRRLADVDPIGVISVALCIATVAYLPLVVGRWPSDPAGVEIKAWASVAALGVVCTALAFVTFFALVAEAGPARSTVITYLNPAVALALGVVVLSEPITPGILLGLPLVVAGCVLATARSAGPVQIPAPEASILGQEV
jgi:drug/metabolite transporter (DMT)-like permease